MPIRGPQRVEDYTPEKGLKEDVQSLLKKFEDTGSVRYEQFNIIWKQMKFPSIYSGRQTERECREFVEECLRLLVEFWSAEASFQTKVGLLYVLYGFYFTQPLDPKCKIRVNEKFWCDMQDFLNDVKNQQHFDVEYVFTTLRFNYAFHFVAYTPWLNPVARHADVETPRVGQDDTSYLDQPSILTEILEPDHIDQLSAIHEHYHRMKCLLAEPGATKPQPALDVIETNLVQFITKTVTTHEEWRKTQAGKKSVRKRRDSGQTTTSESEADSDSDFAPSREKKSPSREKSKSHGIRRAEIKARAFASKGTPTRSRRHRQVETERDSPAPPTSAANKSISSDDDDLMSPSAANIKMETKLDMPVLDSDDEMPSPATSSRGRRSRGRGRGGKGRKTSGDKSGSMISMGRAREPALVGSPENRTAATPSGKGKTKKGKRKSSGSDKAPNSAVKTTPVKTKGSPVQDPSIEGDLMPENAEQVAMTDMTSPNQETSKETMDLMLSPSADQPSGIEYTGLQDKTPVVSGKGKKRKQKRSIGEDRTEMGVKVKKEQEKEGTGSAKKKKTPKEEKTDWEVKKGYGGDTAGEKKPDGKKSRKRSKLKE